jgi:hypothetical protein
MSSLSDKPHLVFFQRRYDRSVPEFLLAHIHDHVKCLSEFFEVTVVREDCDYRQICDRFEPDIVLFESGPNLANCHRLKISNTNTCPEVPKIGLLNADAWSETRAGSLSEMAHWGIETFFSIAVTAGEHTPEIADNLYVWPNFIDPEVFRDYGQPKTNPVFFTGAQASQYPWRTAVHTSISKCYPSLTLPHLGYYRTNSAGNTTMIFGEEYARKINGSWFVPTCGTLAKEVVRKHFEIPACKTCLITEKSPGVEAAGFVDMVNCVFANEDDVVDKIDYLFKNPDELERITDAGYQLVHSKHTMKQRDQIFRWFVLHRSLKPNQRIVQFNPFQAPVVADSESGVGNSPIISNGLHLKLLKQGDELLREGAYQAARDMYARTLSYTRMLPEAKFRLMLCALHEGDASRAISWIIEPIQYTLASYRAVDPDPVEWAWFVVCLLCAGRLRAATRRANQFAWLRHPELDRVRSFVGFLSGRPNRLLTQKSDSSNRRSGIHRLPVRDLREWAAQLFLVLDACHQSRHAQLVSRWVDGLHAGDGHFVFEENILSSRINDAGAEHDSRKHDGTGKPSDWASFVNPVLYFRMRQKLLNLRRRITPANLSLPLHWRRNPGP